MNPIDIIRRWWTDAAPLARAGLVVGLVAVLGALVYFVNAATSSQPIPLFTGMSAMEARQLADDLTTKKIPYELQDNGTTIAVRLPQAEARALRNRITQEGLPSGKVVGWEIFDTSSAITTEFERSIMYQRALQGELSQTITALPQVKRAKVHLALPKKTLLSRGEGQPSASVAVSLKPGRSLTEKEAAGIANLVASSVPDLTTDRITIVDGNGTTISPGQRGPAGKILDLQEKREETLEMDIVELLERTVGSGHVIAKVNVDMDTSRVEETQTELDVDNSIAVVERTQNQETERESNRPQAVAGAQGNLPQAPENGGAAPRGNTESTNRTVTTKEFEVPRKVRQISRPLGDIRRLTISVLIDSNPFEKPPEAAVPAGQGDGDDGAVDVPDGVETPGAALASAKPLAKPDMAMLQSLVQKAVGFDAARGDQVEISFVPFVLPDTVGGDEVRYIHSPLEVWIWVLVTFLVGTGLVVGSLWVTEKRRKEAAIADYAQQLQEKEALIQAQKEEEEGSVPDSTRLRQEVRELTTKNVAATVEVMKGWLRPTLGRN